MDAPITYDDICTHVGRLYLTQQQTLDRQSAAASIRIKQLEAELSTERASRVAAERKLAEAGR